MLSGGWFKCGMHSCKYCRKLSSVNVTCPALDGSVVPSTMKTGNIAQLSYPGFVHSSVSHLVSRIYVMYSAFDSLDIPIDEVGDLLEN